MAWCGACGVALNPIHTSCPLCGSPAGLLPEGRIFPAPTTPGGAPYPPTAGAEFLAGKRARIDRVARIVAPSLSAFLVALNVLTAAPYPWSLHPVAGILAAWAFWRLPRSLPRPPANYLILMGELILLPWLGATAALGGNPAWFISYAFPGISLTASLLIGAILRRQSHPFKKAYAPLLWSLVVALLPLPVALLTPGSPDRIFPGILFFGAGWALAWLLRRSRRWIRSEIARKLGH